MKNTPDERTRVVRRFTIDERLDDSLIRILWVILRHNVTIFDDDPKYWGVESDDYMTPDNFAKIMHVTQANAEEWFWNTLREMRMTQANAGELLPIILREMGMKQTSIEKWMPTLLREMDMKQTDIEEWFPSILRRIHATEIENWLWATLREGQVFLQGGFREVIREGAEVAFEVDAEQRNFKRIDYLSKGRIKKVYINALERRITNGEIDRTR